MRKFHKVFIFFWCLVFSCCLSIKDRAAAFEDIRYELEARFIPEDKKIQGTLKLSFKNNSGRALDEIYLRVYPNHKHTGKEKQRLYEYASYFKVDLYPDGFDPGGFDITTVRGIKGESLSFAFEGEDQTLLRVGLTEPLEKGAVMSLEIVFSSRIPHRRGRYGWHEGTFALNRWYPILGFLDHDGWRKDADYLLHMPYVSEAAMYRLTLELPQEYVAVSGCDIVDRGDGGLSGRKAVVFSTSQPIRELSLAISRDYKLYTKVSGGVEIRSYYFPRDEEAGRRAAEYADSLMRYYTRQFGPYPYKRFSIAPVYLGYGGSQNACLIFVDARLYSMPKFLGKYFDFLVAHETGHQWWYNMVGSDEFRQLWLDEGVNSYWITRYLQDKYGQDAKLIAMPEWLEHFCPNPTFTSLRTYQYIYFVKKGFDQPILSDLPSFYEPSLIFTMAYGKGSAVLDMLAYYLGEKKFSQIMRTYFRRYQFGSAAVEDFIAVAEEIAREPLGWFFRQWLYESKACDYALSRKGQDLVLERKGEIIMPIEIKLEYEDEEDELIRSRGREKQEVIKDLKTRKLKKATADENKRLVDIDRVDNVWPRQLDFRLLPFYHDLYDMPLFLKEDAYNWITGFSWSDYGPGLKSSLHYPGDSVLYTAYYYDSNSECLNAFLGFKKDNFLRKYLRWGFELRDRNAYSDKEDDLRSYKVYLRSELDLAYSLFENNSHMTLYLLHNQRFGSSGFLGSKEDMSGNNYRQKKETIFGLTYYRSSAGSFPDPSKGYRLSATTEVGGHILDAGDAFVRSSLEYDRYVELKKGHKLAVRLKGGGGHPKDKYLFYLGSDCQLRGYDYKEIKGSAFCLGSLEYRFPLMRDIDARWCYNVLNLDEVQAVLFFDAGTAWFDRFNESGFRKDAGLGFRFYFNVAGAAERVALRVDVAHPLDEPGGDTRVWVGVNHVF